MSFWNLLQKAGEKLMEPPSPMKDNGEASQVACETGGGQRSANSFLAKAFNLLTTPAKGSGTKVPSAFGADRPNQFDESMNHIEPTHFVSGDLGSDGSPDPTTSYGAGRRIAPHLGSATGGTRESSSAQPTQGGNLRLPGGKVVQPPASSLSNLSSRLQHVASPADAAGMAKRIFVNASKTVRR